MILLDNIVLSNFALISRVDLLPKALGKKVAAPSQVIEEFSAGITKNRLPTTDLGWLSIVELKFEEDKLFKEHLVRLNAGEAACLAIASNQNGRILTDDRDARKLAAQLKVPVSGTIGILLRLVQIEVLTFSGANELLEKMISKGYRSPVKNLRDL